MEEKVRLQKYLANNGIASRRKAEEYILQGRVKCNGKVITSLGTKIDTNKDIIEFDNKRVKQEENKEYTYILLNKPIDYVTTTKEQFGRKTVLDLLGNTIVSKDKGNAGKNAMLSVGVGECRGRRPRRPYWSKTSTMW